MTRDNLAVGRLDDLEWDGDVVLFPGSGQGPGVVDVDGDGFQDVGAGGLGVGRAALILGLAACAIGGSAAGTPGIVVKLAGALGLLTLTLGFATLITERELLHALFIGSIVLLWVTATVRHVVGRAY